MAFRKVSRATGVFGVGLFLLCGGIMMSQQNLSEEPTVRRVVGLSYPRLANLAGVQGTVKLTAKISTEGIVEGVEVVSGQELLVDSAREALRGWRFRCPAASKSCGVNVNFTFRLLDEVCSTSACPSELEVDLPNSVTVTAKRLRAIVD
jgi:TonB family protein